MYNCKFGLNEHKPFLNNHSDHDHSHKHHHEHDHHEHHHDHRSMDKKVLKIALTITFITMLAEFFMDFCQTLWH